MDPEYDVDYPEYVGTDITYVGSLFTEQEIWAVLQDIWEHKAHHREQSSRRCDLTLQ